MTNTICSIVNHGHSKYIQELLDSFDKFVHNSEGELCIVITNNKISSGERFESKRFKLLYIDNTLNKGFGENHNQAFISYPGSHFVVLNPDLLFIHKIDFCVLLNGWNMITTPLIVTESNVIADFRRRDPTPINLARRYLGLDKHDCVIDSDVGWISGCFMVFHSSLFRALSGFDPGYFLYLEDADICKRALGLGARITVNNDVRVCHIAQRASRKDLGKFFIHLKSLVRYWYKLLR